MQHSVREKIIDLLLQTSDTQLLEQVHSILESAIYFQQGEIWNNLTEDEKQNALLSNKESEDAAHLIDHDQVMKEISARLGWS